MNKKLKAVLTSLLRDIKTNDPRLLDLITRTVNDDRIASILIEAGCDKKYIYAMQDMMKLSLIERRYCVDQILTTMEKKFK